MSVWPQIQSPGRRIGYARVSTGDQKLRMQRQALAAIECDLVFEDHGVSGARKNRTGLDEMLREIRQGDTVIVFKPDRLGRSVVHLADLLVRFGDEGIHFCSICEGINTTTTGGKFIYHMFSAFAEFQRDVIIENTKAGLDAARKSGKKLGRPQKLCAESALGAQRLITQQNVSLAEAARKYGVSRSTLARRLKSLKATGNAEKENLSSRHLLD
ncbi:invertase [Ruegeria sp. ANG-R]|uniref:recombinase family protein n=1 Tax=Ruegeria sp. ANG-R TaxID=1577903 RepID=UPI00057D5410|nr:recombinase family protein [Ruegeria sp. ANG-R]KIC41585.1 invertase [Ruegeria sp. ANG-R]